jgi:hypothetical protein
MIAHRKVREYLDPAAVQEHTSPPIHGLGRDGFLGRRNPVPPMESGFYPAARHNPHISPQRSGRRHAANLRITCTRYRSAIGIGCLPKKTSRGEAGSISKEEKTLLKARLEHSCWPSFTLFPGVTLLPTLRAPVPEDLSRNAVNSIPAFFLRRQHVTRSVLDYSISEESRLEPTTPISDVAFRVRSGFSKGPPRYRYRWCPSPPPSCAERWPAHTRNFPADTSWRLPCRVSAQRQLSVLRKRPQLGHLECESDAPNGQREERTHK